MYAKRGAGKQMTIWFPQSPLTLQGLCNGSLVGKLQAPGTCCRVGRSFWLARVTFNLPPRHPELDASPLIFNLMSATCLGPLWAFFHKGEAQNSRYNNAYCHSCVAVKLKLEPEGNAAEHYFHDACEAAGKTRGTRDAMLAHLISGTARKCKDTSDAAEEEEALGQAMAEAAEDEVPDDGAIEIGSDEEYQ
ncbi:hypothetical protein JB92DRAFT_3093744 [Gautieria morchelliformis]|nr:hypothetical protein JB92DRAFT_3093744 [Gautieria morchelliformis]